MQAPTEEPSLRRFLSLLRRLGVEVRPDEARRVGLLFLYSLLLGVFQFSGKAVRQASFVDQAGAEQLPLVYLLVAVVAYPTLRGYERAADRWSRDQVVLATLVVSALGMVGFWWWMQTPSRAVSYCFYLWIALATALTLTQLWAYVNHLLDARQARRLFALIGAGSLLGGVLGGQIARLAGQWQLRHALLVAALMLLACGAIVRVIERGAGRRATLSGRVPTMPARTEPEPGVFRSRHVRLIATVMFLTVVVAEVIDLQFNWVVEQNTETLAERAAAFGNVFSLMGLAAFVFQLVFTSRIHRSLGVGFAMRVLPFFVLVLSLVVAFGTLLLPIVPVYLVAALRVGDNGLRYSLDHATRELLFVPVPARHRAAAKGAVDVFVHRFAKGIGALALLTVTFGLVEVLSTAWLAVILALAWLVLTVFAERHYIEALRGGLAARRNGEPDLGLDPTDVTTLEALVESLGSNDSRVVVHAIDLLQSHGRGRLVPPVLLHHAEAPVRRRVLEVLLAAGRRDALELIESRLRDDDGDVRAAAVSALAGLTERQRDELMRPRLVDADPRVRAAAIGSLAVHPDGEVTREALDALEELMGDGQPLIRAHAARALAQLEEPILQERLIRLLYDPDPLVVRAAIDAVRQRLERSHSNPLFVPILISLLRERRLKHVARETLASYGESVLPALQHFMNDANEQIWVRRALPLTVARFRSPAALEVLYQALERNEDRFLRRKLIESLVDLRHLPQTQQVLDRQIGSESLHAAEATAWLVGLSKPASFQIQGVRWQWSVVSRPTFLQRLIEELRAGHLRNLAHLIRLREDPLDEGGVVDALDQLEDRNRRRRGRAIEFLDNVLSETTLRQVLPLIDELDLPERLQLLQRRFDVVVAERSETLQQMIRRGMSELSYRTIGATALSEGCGDGDARALRWLPRLTERPSDDLYAETARWLRSRVIP